MGKRFNINGLCIPDRHYMVDITGRLQQIKKMVDEGEYFTINRGRQYGKTTTLFLLKSCLEQDYTVFSISFEGLSDNNFTEENIFYRMILRLFLDTIEYEEVSNVDEKVVTLLREVTSESHSSIDSIDFSNIISQICKLNGKPVVLMVDEVDQAANYEMFLSFLGLLREKYLKRVSRPTFQSVILAGVYDVKNLKLKIRNGGENQYNSPWNIAAKFTIEMAFDVENIKDMLAEYESDHHIGMDVDGLAGLIYAYTSGYPYLVSELCKIMDEQLLSQMDCKEEREVWSAAGVLSAVRILLAEANTLFDDMRKKLEEYEELREMLYALLFEGQEYLYNEYNFAIDVASMFSYIKKQNGKVEVANRIFETWIYNWFISEERVNNRIFDAGANDRSQFIQNGQLNMEHILERFVVHFSELYGDSDESFIEKVGRKYFLFYLKPIINGTGNYYVEAETRDSKRTDVIVDYLGQQYIVELKIWHGDEYNKRGEEQLVEYLDAYHLNQGYMLSFCFNKKKNIGIRKIKIKDKTLVEAVV